MFGHYISSVRQIRIENYNKQWNYINFLPWDPGGQHCECGGAGLLQIIIEKLTGGETIWD